jgi:hypothetical protein
VRPRRGGHDGARGELGCDHDSVRLYQHQRLRHSHQHPTRSASQRTSKQHTRAATSGVRARYNHISR